MFPNLITHVATTDATVTDNQMTGAIHGELTGKTLAPGRHYTDSGYLSAALVFSELARHGIALIGPLLADTSAQARAGAGYARADFTVDYDTQAVTCPQGKTAANWTPCTQHGKDAIVATFSASDCGPCPARGLCTTGNRRQLSLPPATEPGAHATAACPRPASTTCTWPPPSTCSACRPSGPTRPWTGSEPATWHVSNSASPHRTRINHQDLNRCAWPCRGRSELRRWLARVDHARQSAARGLTS